MEGCVEAAPDEVRFLRRGRVIGGRVHSFTVYQSGSVGIDVGKTIMTFGFHFKD
jgi:hypothetical protein